MDAALIFMAGDGDLDHAEKRFKDNQKRILAKRDAGIPLTWQEAFFLGFIGDNHDIRG